MILYVGKNFLKHIEALLDFGNFGKRWIGTNHIKLQFIVGILWRKVFLDSLIRFIQALAQLL